MGYLADVSKGSLNPVNFFKTKWWSFQRWKDDPNFFSPSGIWVYTGPQGSGKTLSAVRAVSILKKEFPLVQVYSNLELNLGFEYDIFDSYDQISLSNGTHGIIFLIDEIHVLWNSLESKKIPYSEMACFCQMRKDRRVIIGTSQVYGRIAKPIREQLQYVWICNNYFGVLQHNTLMDPSISPDDGGHVTGAVLRNDWWFHTPDMYSSYDTLNKIERWR